MSTIDRREFLRASGTTGIGLATAAWAAESAKAREKAAAEVTPNEKIVLAMVGVRGRGGQLAKDFVSRPDFEIAYIADVDLNMAQARASEIDQIQGRAPTVVQDLRRALDDKAVDAIVVATPDHWHALATVWGCQAGKHVYVEKPASHTPWEGRKMVEAARKYDRVVQVGLQNRSAPYNKGAKEYIESGKLGTIHLCRVFNQKHNAPPQPQADTEPPPNFDWNMWTGPAPESPFNTNYRDRWHSFWRYSGGDIINDGVHQMDLARWLIGKDYPLSVHCTAGRYASKESVEETPDAQIAVYDFGDMIMTLELTLYTPYMHKIDPVVRNGDLFPYWPQCATRIELYGTEGLMFIGRHGGGWQVFDRTKNREPVVKAQQFGRFPDPEHKQNFADAIRSGSRPSADIEEGHRSTLLCQYANISHRVGNEKLVIDPATERTTDHAAANDLMKREYRSPWVIPEVV